MSKRLRLRRGLACAVVAATCANSVQSPDAGATTVQIAQDPCAGTASRACDNIGSSVDYAQQTVAKLWVC